MENENIHEGIVIIQLRKRLKSSKILKVSLLCLAVTNSKTCTCSSHVSPYGKFRIVINKLITVVQYEG